MVDIATTNYTTLINRTLRKLVVAMRVQIVECHEMSVSGAAGRVKPPSTKQYVVDSLKRPVRTGRKNNNEVPQATTDCSSGYFCTSARFSTNLNPAASSNVAGVSFKLFVFLVVCRFKFKSCVLLVVLPLRVPHCSLRMGCCTPDRTWSVYRTQARDKCAPDAELIMFQMSRHV